MIRLLALACAAAVCFGAEPSLAAAEADTVYLNGKVFTADRASTVAQAFAVKGETFLAVGGDTEVRAHAGPQTRVVDLKGAFVVPGLSDAHFHSEGGGPGIDLSEAANMQDVLDAVAARVRLTPAGAVVTSNGDWHETQLKERRLPTAADLDRVARLHPVVLSRGGHEYILNSAALRKWGITETTVSPPGGRIGKDPSGKLNGELIDAAKRLVQLPPPPPLGPADVLRTQQVLNSFGITSVRITGRYKHTAGGPGDLDMSSAFNTYRLLKQVATAER